MRRWLTGLPSVLWSTQFSRFLITGGVAALANIFSRVPLNRVMPFELAVVLAYGVGMLTAYLLARWFVFAQSGRTMGSEMLRFAFVNAIAFVLVWIVSVGLARVIFPSLKFTWHADGIAHVIGVIAPTVSSFLGHRHYTFVRKMP